MGSKPGGAPESVLLILADISGYTRHMTANVRSLAHGQSIITELMEAIIQAAELPFEIAKLEGDAIFLFCRTPAGSQTGAELRRTLGGKLLQFFTVFRSQVERLGRATTCSCQACSNISTLHLKVIVHHGEALFHQVLHFQELAGVDVIIAHRLLKNTVPAAEYLLLSEAARAMVELPEAARLVRGVEFYDGLGRVDTHIFLPGGGEVPVPAPSEDSWVIRFQDSWSMFCRLWFAPLRGANGAKGRTFHHLSTGAHRLSRLAFAALTLLLTPLFVPAGAVVALFHSWRSPEKVRPRPPHQHGPDCGCGHQH